MSEKASTQSSIETDDQPRLEGAPEALQLDALDDLMNLRSEFDNQTEVSSFSEYKSQRIPQLLAEHGMEDSSEDAQTRQNYAFAENVYAQVSELDDTGWYGIPEGASRAYREVVAENIRTWYADQVEQDQDSEVEQTSDFDAEEVKVANSDSKEEGDSVAEETEVTSKVDVTSQDYLEGLAKESAYGDKLAKQYADLNAERSKAMIDRSNTREAIESTKNELAQSIQDIGAEYYFQLESEGMSHEEIVQKVDEFVSEQTDRIMEQMEANLLAEYQSSSPVMKRLYDAWAVLGEKGWKGKIAKGALLGGAGALAGGVVALGAGVAGAGVVGAGAAALLTRSVGRNLVGNKLDRVANAEKTGTEQTAGIREQITDETTHDTILDLIDRSSEKYRKRNTKRMVGGIAIGLSAGVLGGLAAEGAAHVVDATHSIGDKLSDAAGFVKGKFDTFQADRRDGGLIDSDFLGDSPESPDTPAPTDASPDTGGTDGGGVDNGSAEAPVQTNRETLFDGFHSTRELTPEGQEALLKELNNYQVKSGDTIWDISEKMLEEKGVKNPSVYEIDATKDFLLQELQSQGYADSRGWLNAGDTIKLR